MWLQLVHFAKSRYFFFISQNPDFINVVENVDFAKSRFFLFRRIQIFFYFAESMFRNFAKSIFRKIQLADKQDLNLPGTSQTQHRR